MLALCLAPGGALGADRDADGVDDVADDCSATSNPDQRDTDLDGFGNACDPDFDDDGVVGNADLVALQRAWGAQLGEPAYSADFDLDGDGEVGNLDLSQASRRYGGPPGPSGLSCAGQAPCFAGYVAIEGAEEVLSGSVLLRWQAAVPASLFQIERRTPGGAWSLAGRVGATAREFVDRGPGGEGFDPGRYEYRVRGGGPWSQVFGFTLAAECAGQPATSPSLPVVEIADSEPDGDYDGDDVEAALRSCSDRHGCVLRALPVVYDDVNAELAMRIGYDFSQGLVIEGYGSATVFRSRVFSSQDHDPSLCPANSQGLCYRPRPVLSIIQVDKIGHDGVRFRNFTIDGRKREQPDPGTQQNSWDHWGIAVRAHANDGCVHNVTARQLLVGGFEVRDASGWILERSTAAHVGCLDDLTRCDSLRRTPEWSAIPGLRSDGYGFLVEGGTSGTVVRDNRALRAVKYGFGAVFGAQDFDFHGNVVRSGMVAGIECNGCRRGVFERNVVRSMHQPTGRNSTWPDGYIGQTAHGIQCGGTVEDLTVRDNVVVGGDGSGVRITCSGPRIVVQGNVIDGNCGVHGRGLLIANAEAVSALGNVVRDGPGRCPWSIEVQSSRDVLIEGGWVETGPGTLVGLIALGTAQRPTSGLVLRKLHFDARGASASGLLLDSTVTGATLYDSVCVSGYPFPLVDRSAGGALHLADPGNECVP